MKDIWNLQHGTRIVVDANQYDQPIGKEASKLVEFLGAIARTGKVEDSDILSHVGKLQKEFKLTLKTRYYKEMVQEGRPVQEIYENNPPSAQSEKAKEFRTNVRYAHTTGRTGYATLNAQFAKNEGREPSHLEQFRFQHLRKDGSDKLSSEAAQQVYDEACKMVKDSMPTPESSFTPQNNTELENKVYTQVFGPEKDGKMLAYGHGMTKSRLFGYRFMKLTEIQEVKFMEMLDARDKKYKVLIDECMAKGMSIEFQSSGLDDKAFSSDDDE
ncbi:hypothetical protein GOBAR_AA09545 [Gossypium barbadense]|uniref:Uncharacterized protein n=1 Tax=Gossypium barbadense TaxID=3634 RepID=A0A2P5Y683_GOSBA|nr:hypothetical protein GOBAR_AA09545 [Gossypium barbadense]